MIIPTGHIIMFMYLAIFGKKLLSGLKASEIMIFIDHKNVAIDKQVMARRNS